MYHVYSINSIPQAAAEKIGEFFGMRFLHNRDATMAAAPTASPLLDLLGQCEYSH